MPGNPFRARMYKDWNKFWFLMCMTVLHCSFDISWSQRDAGRDLWEVLRPASCVTNDSSDHLELFQGWVSKASRTEIPQLTWSNLFPCCITLLVKKGLLVAILQDVVLSLELSPAQTGIGQLYHLWNHSSNSCRLLFYYHSTSSSPSSHTSCALCASLCYLVFHWTFFSFPKY